MAKPIVSIELSQAQEIALLERYGRGCSRETLVARAIAEAVSLKSPWVKPVRTERKKLEPNQTPSNGESKESNA